MASYQIGQYRFTGSNCVTDLTKTTSKNTIATSFSMGTSQSTQEGSFIDIVIKPSESFSKNEDYYLYLAIPQDLNYDMSFSLKLTKESNGGDTSYQFLKSISILKGSDTTSGHDVCLFKGIDDKIYVSFIIDYASVSALAKANLSVGNIYRVIDKNQKATYYVGKGKSNYRATTNYNKLSMTETWLAGQTSFNAGIFEICFRPVEDGFDSILLQMTRTAEDYSIVKEDGTYGRRINLNQFQFKLYQLMNKVDDMNKNGSLSRIGVWGHAGMLMSINGEEIRIGPSGFYELDTIDVTSLGVVAPDGDYTNNWTCDYEYKVTDDVSSISEEGSE